jgi:hypothetical protein
MKMLEEDDSWFTRDAARATAGYGRRTIDMIVDYLEETAR